MKDSMWLEFKELINSIPYNGKDINLIKPTNISYLNAQDDSSDYHIKIIDHKKQNDIAPIEYLRKTISNIIIHREKGESQKRIRTKYS